MTTALDTTTGGTVNTDTSLRVIDNTTGEVGTFHRSRFTGTPWFTPDDGERDELGRVIPTMVDEDMDLSPLDD